MSSPAASSSASRSPARSSTTPSWCSPTSRPAAAPPGRTTARPRRPQTPPGDRLKAAFTDAARGLHARRRRSLLTALGIFLAAAMLSAALVVSDSLGLGFNRAAKAAGLPEVIVRFNPQNANRVAQRIRALPDIAGFSLRQEHTGVPVNTGSHGDGN